MTRSEPPDAHDAALRQDELWSAAEGGGEESSPSMAHPGSRTVRTSQTITEGITSTARIPGPAGSFFADVPNRIVAMIIDIIVLSLIGFVLAVLLGGLVSQPGALDAPGGELDVPALMVMLALMLGVSLLYFGYLWVALRGTLGMRILGLQVGDETDGHSLGWRQAVLRWAIVGIPAVLVSMAVYVPHLVGLLASAVGLVWLALLLSTVARSTTKQGIQDRSAHSVVLKRRRRAA